MAWGEGAEAVAIACNVMQVVTASTPEVAIIVVTYFAEALLYAVASP